MPIFRYSSRIAASAVELFAWHRRPGALQRLTPPWEAVEVVRADPPADGSRVALRVQVAPGVRVPWRLRHDDVVEPSGFADVQEEGPFASWRHVHRFVDGDGGAEVVDEITWEPPAGAAVGWLAEPVLTARLARLFRFRHRRLEDDLARHRPWAGHPPLTVAVTGATGLVGSALVPFLTAGGHRVRRVVRRDPGQDDVLWSVRDGTIEREKLDGVDAVVHLAGASIAGQRWTPAYKEEILRSRVDGTRLLCETLAAMPRKPGVLVASSGIGYHGDTGPREVTEADPPGDTFLAEVCQAWEAATAPARQAGIRVVNLRTGIVLARNGGALATMLPAARAGLGGPVGGGRQFYPCIALDDLVGVIHVALMDARFEGPIHAVGPEPVAQGELARILGRVLGRPAIVPAPALALRLAMGRQMADELVIQGQRAIPARLRELGFAWRHPTVEEALRFELGRA